MSSHEAYNRMFYLGNFQEESSGPHEHRHHFIEKGLVLTERIEIPPVHRDTVYGSRVNFMSFEELHGPNKTVSFDNIVFNLTPVNTSVHLFPEQFKEFEYISHWGNSDYRLLAFLGNQPEIRDFVNQDLFKPGLLEAPSEDEIGIRRYAQKHGAEHLTWDTSG